MKLLLASVILAPVFAFSQQRTPSPTPSQRTPYSRLAPDSVILRQSGGVLSHQTSKGRIYTLKAGMPCLVPDKKNIAKMPNALERQPLPFIPNAVPDEKH